MVLDDCFNYRNYDAEAAFQRMRKAGVFNSAPADN